MSILAWIEDQKRLKLLNAPKYVNPASDSSKGLWTRCDKCGVILYIKHLKENQRVCFGCSYHLQMSSQERVENLLDKDSWRPLDETVSPCDPLEFHDQKDYTDRLQEAQERTGLQDAIQTGSGMVDGIPIALGVMDFEFMGGSMGSVVGEKVTRLIEYATQEGLTLVLVCASGGARMQEGVFSLMQMAKISSALQVYQACANLLYISILTSPTTGGVTASFAMLGDIIFAEPKALVAFAGRRVIEQTLCEDLPEDFQTSEYMLHHGLLDLIVPRRFFRQALSESIRIYKNAPFKKPGRIPFGVQNPITFLVEERIRRQWAVGNAPIAHKLSRLLAESKGKDLSTLGVTTPNSSSKSITVSAPAENAQTQLQDKESSSQANVFNKNGYNAFASQREQKHELTKALSSGYAQEIERTNDFSQDSKLSQHEIVEETEAQTADRKKERDSVLTPSVETPAIASTQDQRTFQRASQSRGSDSLDVSLQKHDSSDLIAPKVLQNRTTVLPIDDLLNPLLQRERVDYREILISFQTMFNLFSKELVVPYDSVYAKDTRLDEKKAGELVSGMEKRTNREQTPYEINSQDLNANSSQEVADVCSGTSTSDLLLHNFLTLSEKQDSKIESQEADQTKNTINSKHDTSSDTVSTSLETVSAGTVTPTPAVSSQAMEQLSIYKDVLPSSGSSKELVGSPSIYLDFLNQSIELSATESVEWRAFYLHQRISQRTGFIEDMAQSLHKYPKDNNQIAFQNMLFYRSICRKVS